MVKLRRNQGNIELCGRSSRKVQVPPDSWRFADPKTYLAWIVYR